MNDITTVMRPKASPGAMVFAAATLVLIGMAIGLVLSFVAYSAKPNHEPLAHAAMLVGHPEHDVQEAMERAGARLGGKFSTAGQLAMGQRDLHPQTHIQPIGPVWRYSVGSRVGTGVVLFFFDSHGTVFAVHSADDEF